MVPCALLGMTPEHRAQSTARCVVYPHPLNTPQACNWRNIWIILKPAAGSSSWGQGQPWRVFEAVSESLIDPHPVFSAWSDCTCQVSHLMLMNWVIDSLLFTKVQGLLGLSSFLQVPFLIQDFLQDIMDQLFIKSPLEKMLTFNFSWPFEEWWWKCSFFGPAWMIQHHISKVMKLSLTHTLIEYLSKTSKTRLML